MKLILLSYLLFGLLLSTMSHAQTACPPGMEEYGAGVCGYSQSEESAQQAPQQQFPQKQAPPTRWATRWGAVATDGPGGHLGAVTDLSSKSEAERAAIADCRAKGGLQCAVEISYDNECAAMAVGDKIHNVTADVTLDKAIQSSIKTCREADTNCHVYYTACSLPARIQ